MQYRSLDTGQCSLFMKKQQSYRIAVTEAAGDLNVDVRPVEG